MRPNTCLFFVCVTSIAIGTGCTAKKSCDVTQSEISQDYSVGYTEERGSTSASASYSFGSQGLQLTGGSNVVGDPISLSESSDAFGNVYYSGSSSGFVPTHTFTFTDCAGKAYTNSVTMNTVGFTSPGTISKAAGVTIPFTGGALESGETVTVSYSPAAGQTVNTYPSSPVHSTVGSTAITLASGNFMNADTGSFYITMSRKRSPILQGGNAGGSFAGTYVTSKQAVTIAP